MGVWARLSFVLLAGHLVSDAFLYRRNSRAWTTTRKITRGLLMLKSSVSLSISGDPSRVQKISLKDLVAGMEEEENTKLQNELTTASSSNPWGNEECLTFIRKLIQSGNLETAKKACGGTVPLPTPTNTGSGNTANSAGDNSNRHENEQLSSILEFVLYVGECAEENEDTENYVIYLYYDDGESIVCNSVKQESTELRHQIENKTASLTGICCMWKKKNESTAKGGFLTTDLKKSQVDRFFEKLVEDKDALKSFLPPLAPLEDSTYIKPRKDYVRSQPEDAHLFFEMENQADKTFAIVVAGESGSGKSVFACLHSSRSGYLPIYLVYKPKKSKDDEKSDSERGQQKIALLPEKPPADEYPMLNAVFRAAISDATDNEEDRNNATDHEEDCNNLYRLKTKVNISRDTWAKSVLKCMIGNLSKRGDAAFGKWLDGRWSQNNRPSKVAIILDEATDVDLVEGLISTVRETTLSFSYLAKDKVQLVLAGVGLDAIGEEGRIGTNPAYSKLVTMLGPEVSQVVHGESEVDSSIASALQDGLIARVLKTNTRMFFRGLLPVFQWSIHRVDSKTLSPKKKKVRLDQRLKSIGSFPDLMDYPVRYYVNQNSVGDLEENTRSSLLFQSFLYHLVKSMEDLNKRVEGISLQPKVQNELEIAQNFEQYRKIREEPTHNIFAKGLARRAGTSNDGTSNALKYMACFGLTCRVRPTFGEEFEEITALHYMRYGEVKGYEPFRITLQNAWPPARYKGVSVSGLKEILTNQKEVEIANLNQEFKEKVGKWCIVFSQGTANAQGGDVLGLLLNLDTKHGILDCIQCKSYQKRPNGNEVCLSWWKSLGIEMSGSNSDPDADLSPTEGETSAAYSYQGLDSFRGLLQEWLQSFEVKVVFGDRILAMSFPTPSTFPVPKHEKCRVWFREMLEPTISVLPGKIGLIPKDCQE